MKVPRMRMNEEGLNRFFGPLEAQIMQIIWNHKETTIRQVQEYLDEELSYTAIMTVMNRLHEKGHLKKKTTGAGRNRLSVFQSVQSKEEFLQEQTKAVTEGLVQEYGELVVNHLFDAVQKADPELLKLLEERLNEWKRDPS
ncbi:transcriptional regulator [Cohnella sp. CIP 111063]|uniref:BlaI/MecI/CopY family transcriptional regulator n=1 Tax=unclassified Cohnella TaxID=2636738 RepID=UPI000B8BC8A4|nr:MULTISPECIES: BlaI/MecI/CopY family transcriptional regulator [unclassified Cohnella]OXS54960.1 transcriptional regulator [Cohnella sp. CIP 111063]PRX65103.1 putative transcriptional regulator [Cohnella sp. SGD-V74]